MIGALDTEFTDFIVTHLISLGIVCDNGDEFYVEVDYPKHLASTFVKQVVEPFLMGYPVQVPVMQAALRLVKWLEERPELVIVADFNGDFTLMEQLLKLADFKMPKTKHLLEMFVNPCDAMAFIKFEDGQSSYFRDVDMRQHHSLVDAKALMAGLKAAKLV